MKESNCMNSNHTHEKMYINGPSQNKKGYLSANKNVISYSIYVD